MTLPPGLLLFFQKPRAQRRGKGAFLLVSSANKSSAISLPTQASFEAISGKLEFGQSCLVILKIYFPPCPTTIFFSKLQDILSYISTLPNDLALMGNVYNCIDSPSFDAGQVSGILESFDFHQYVDFPTHIHSRSLELMICSTACNVLYVSSSDLISDHFSVVADMQIPSNHSRTVPQTINCRKLQSLNMKAFKADIKNSELIRHPKINSTGLPQQYILHTLINCHPQLVTTRTSSNPPHPLLTHDILPSKRHRSYLEGVWHKNPTTLTVQNLLGGHTSATERFQRQYEAKMAAFEPTDFSNRNGSGIFDVRGASHEIYRNHWLGNISPMTLSAVVLVLF